MLSYVDIRSENEQSNDFSPLLDLKSININSFSHQFKQNEIILTIIAASKCFVNRYCL